MKSPSVTTIIGVFTALVVLGLGVWYARSEKTDTAVTNIQTFQITEKKCSIQTTAEQAAAADLILTGEVFVVLPDEPDALVYMKPLTVYKGLPPMPLIIRANAGENVPAGESGRRQIIVLPDGSRQNELHFASEQPPYLLFLRKSDNKFLTSRCDGSRVLGSGLNEGEQSVLKK